jgi:hypothetical protein
MASSRRGITDVGTTGVRGAKGHTQPDHGAETVGAEERGMPCDRRSPIVAGNRCSVDAKRIKKTHHVADEMQQRVLIDCVGPIGLAVAAHIGRDDAEAGRRQRC